MPKEHGRTPKNPDVIRVGNIVEVAKNGQKPMSIAEAEMRRIVEESRWGFVMLPQIDIVKKSEGVVKEAEGKASIDNLSA